MTHTTKGTFARHAALFLGVVAVAIFVSWGSAFIFGGIYPEGAGFLLSLSLLLGALVGGWLYTKGQLSLGARLAGMRKIPSFSPLLLALNALWVGMLVLVITMFFMMVMFAMAFSTSASFGEIVFAFPLSYYLLFCLFCVPPALLYVASHNISRKYVASKAANA